MLKGLINDALLKVRMKSGFSGGLVVFAMLSLLFALMTFVFVCVTGYVWLASRYDNVTAGLVMAGLFLLLTLIALITCLLIRRSTIQKARAELVLAAAARKQAALFDPAMLTVGLQVLQTLGLKRILPLAGIALLAASVARELMRSGANDDPSVK